MPITSILRDQDNDVSIVRIVTTDTLADVIATGYVDEQIPYTTALNKGVWGWRSSDLVCVYASNGSNGHNFFEFINEDFSTFVQTATGAGVTQISTGTGLTGGPITTVGTISYAPIAANSVWGNPNNTSSVPQVRGISNFRNDIGVGVDFNFNVLGNVTLTNPCPTWFEVNNPVDMTLTLPVMNSTTPGAKSLVKGQFITVRNVGVANVTIKYNDGTTLLTLLPGQWTQLINLDNGTTNGLFNVNSNTYDPVFNDATINSIYGVGATLPIGNNLSTININNTTIDTVGNMNMYGGQIVSTDHVNISIFLTVNDFYIVMDTTIAPLTCHLPLTPVNGQQYIIKDAAGTAGTNAITIDGNGNNIDGSATQTIANPYGSMHLIYSSISKWGIV